MRLAIQRSMMDDADPELTGGDPSARDRPSTAPRPTSSASSRPGGAAASSGSVVSASASRRSAPELTGGDGGGGPPRYFASDPEVAVPTPSESGAAAASYVSNPEVLEPGTGSVADEAGGGGGRPLTPASPTPPSGSGMPASSAFASPSLSSGQPHRPGWSAVAASGADGGAGGTAAPATAVVGGDDVDAEVRRALEFARNKEFDEAEACLAALCAQHPEQQQCREVQAAWEAVTMCKQFHAAKP